MRLPRQPLSHARLPRWLSFPRLRGGERSATEHKPVTETATEPTRKSTLARPTRFTLPAIDLKQAVGIHIGEDEVCVALVAQTLRGPRLRRACRVSLRAGTGNAEEPKRRVMVVDDNPVDREVVRSLFLKRDFEVLTAVDGRDALDQLKAAAVDLIVTDLMMPRLDGTGLLKELGSITPRPPAIVMSAYGNKDADINTAVEVAKKGAYGYLGKPVGPDQLFEMVGKCLAEQHREDDVLAVREFDLNGLARCLAVPELR